MWRNKKKAAGRLFAKMKGAENVIFFDTETTGLEDDAKIRQFSGRMYSYDWYTKGLKERYTKDVYINPEEPLSKKIIEITGITDDILSTAPNETALGPEILEFMERADIWIAYNAGFDTARLKKMAERIGAAYMEKEVVDALEMARDCLPDLKSHSLSDVSAFLYPDDMHRFHYSMEDVDAMVRIFMWCIREYGREYDQKNEKKRYARVVFASCYPNIRAGRDQRIKIKIDDPVFEACLSEEKERYIAKNRVKLEKKRDQWLAENITLLARYSEAKRHEAASLENFLPDMFDPNNTGRIFWHIIDRAWGCKSDRISKKLFSELDMEAIEEQVLYRYGNMFSAKSMDELGKAWLRYSKEKRAG